MIDKYSITIATTCSFQSVHPQVMTWVGRQMWWLSRDPRCKKALCGWDAKHRIHNSRNAIAKKALDMEATFLLFIDPDMDADVRLKRPHLDSDHQPDARDWAQPFLETSLGFMMSQPCGIIGAPAISGPPECKLNVFIEDRAAEGFRRMRTEEYAATKPQFLPVFAIGTGQMLIDVSIFKTMPPPWFEDVYDSNSQSFEPAISQDCNFCIKANKLGIPVVANMFAPAGHEKLDCYVPPDYLPAAMPVGRQGRHDKPQQAA